MQEFENVTSETAVQPKELTELIARLSNPHQISPSGGVRIRDIAETMDLKDEEVIQELVKLRKLKEVRPVPLEAEKLAIALDELKTSNFNPISNQRLTRVTFVSVVLIGGLVYWIFANLASYISHGPYTQPPTQVTNPVSESPSK